MNITIIGCGAFAKGIASLLEQNNITMWVHQASEINNLQKEMPRLKFETNLNNSLKKADAIFILVSSPFFKDIIDNIKLNENIPIYIGTKGMLENEFLSSYAKKKLKKDNIYYMAGPNLADDLRKKVPVGFTLSQNDDNLLRKMLPEYIIIDNDFEPNLEFYSIFKNIIAIGSGIIYELTNSYSTVLTYLTKALEEIKNPKILYGTIGDYYLTGTSFNSRNFNFGKILVNNKENAQDYLKNNTVEGYIMLKNLYNYLKQHNYELEILNILYSIIYENKNENLLLEYLK